MEHLISTLIGLATGLISGLLSGGMVTKYYRKKDEEKENDKIRLNYITIFCNYINKIITEARVLKESNDYKELYRLLNKKMEILPELYSVMDENTRDKFEKIVVCLNSLEQRVKNKTITAEEIESEAIMINTELLNIQILYFNQKCTL